MHTNDCIVELLGGGVGDINDLLFAYFGGGVDQNLQDAEYGWLVAHGATPGQINDMWFEYLTGLTLEGALVDMLNEFW